MRYWRLIECRSPELLTLTPLRIDERVLHFLTGLDVMDERLQGFAERIEATESLPASQQAVAGQVTTLWSRVRREARWPVVQLCGPDANATRAVAALAVRDREEIRLYAAQSADLPRSATERGLLVRLWERETVLGAVALLVELDKDDAAEETRAAAAFVEEANGILFVACREPLSALRRGAVRCDVNKPGAREQRHAPLGNRAG